MRITRLLLPAAVVLSLASSQACIAAHPWPFYHRNYGRTGQGDMPGPRYVDIKWSVSLGSAPVTANYASPTIDEQGRVYVGTSDGILHVLNADGSPAWQYATGHTKTTAFGNANTPSAAIAPDGTVYVLDPEAFLHKLNSSGGLVWTYDSPGDAADGHPIVHPNGDIIIGVYQYFPPPNLGGNAHLISLKPDKSVNWTKTNNGMGHVLAGPAIDDVGDVYVTAFDGPLGHVWKYGPDGSLRWVYNNPAQIYNSAALDSLGHLLFVDATGYLVALQQSTGNVDWQLKIGSFSQASPAVTTDGQIIANAYTDSVNGVSADGGALRWNFKAVGRARAGASLDSLGSAYFGVDGGTIWALGKAGRPLWNVNLGSANTRSTPAFDAAGNLYLATDTATGPKLVCIEAAFDSTETVGGAKDLANSVTVAIPGKVVTSVGAGFFTVQEFSASAGIRVNSTQAVAVGDVVDIGGVMGSGTTERVINASTVTKIGTAALPKPVYMHGGSVGGGTQGVNTGPDEGHGLNAVALLVKTTGAVGNVVDLGGGSFSFTLNDGSAPNGVKIIAPVAPTGAHASATGVVYTASSGGHVIATIVVKASADVVNED
ncbi:MAG: PQQ-binding-like beta-propeller repeat protein [Armatimonadota bacterium]